MVVGLYAMKYPARVSRVVQLGAGAPDPSKVYPRHLTGADGIMAEMNARIAELQKEAASMSPEELGRKTWVLMRVLYVTNPADADKIQWNVEHLPNESFTRLLAYYSQYLAPSFQGMKLTAEDFGKVKTPVLVVHGTRDRQCPYGGARDWAASWPNARLVTVEDAAHLAWIENPAKVFGSVKTFLDGYWPEDAEAIKQALA
jgi:pimeloyl-ACP methyl ester carboxylesterase